MYVDDEQEIANLGKTVLEKLGYKVTIQTSSIDALNLFNRQPDQFDLIITDHI